MTSEDKRRMLLRFDGLIRMKFRGGPKELAKRLGISQSTFFRLLDYLKVELQVPIKYDPDLGRYVYTCEGFIYLGFLPDDVIIPEKLKEYSRKVNMEAEEQL